MKFAITKDAVEEIQMLINQLRQETGKIRDAENKVRSLFQNTGSFGIFQESLFSWLTQAEINRKEIEESAEKTIHGLELMKNRIEDLLSVNWADSMNTAAELEVIEKEENILKDIIKQESKEKDGLQVYEGYISPEVKNDATEPKNRKPNTPRTTGYFDGIPGDSTFFPYSESAKKVLKQFSKSSVEYKKGYPDFSPFTRHDSKWGIFDFSVEIGHMTDIRKGTETDGDFVTGNYTQAELAFCNMINEANKEKTESQVTLSEFRLWYKNTGLTIHECEDGRSVQLVPADLHKACPHSGGVSEQKYRMAMGNQELYDIDEEIKDLMNLELLSEIKRKNL